MIKEVKWEKLQQSKGIVKHTIRVMTHPTFEKLYDIDEIITCIDDSCKKNNISYIIIGEITKNEYGEIDIFEFIGKGEDIHKVCLDIVGFQD